MTDINFEARMMLLQNNMNTVMSYFTRIMGQQTDFMALSRASESGDLSAFVDMMGLITRMEPAFEALAKTVRELESRS